MTDTKLTPASAKSKSGPSVRRSRAMKRSKATLYYSGKRSTKFWRRVAQDGRLKIYRAACRLQELEVAVVRSLAGKPVIPDHRSGKDRRHGVKR